MSDDFDGVRLDAIPAGITGPLVELALAEFKRRLRLTSLVASHSGVLSENDLARMPCTERRYEPREVLPLPFIHADAKQPKPGTAYEWEWVPRAVLDKDPTLLQACSRRVGELVEKTFCARLLAAAGAARLTHAIPLTGGGSERRFAGGDLFALVTERMIPAAHASHFYGPFAVLHGVAWDAAFDQDQNRPHADPVSARQALLDYICPGDGNDHLIVTIKGIDFFPPEALALLQLTPDVVRVVEGMAFRVVPWDVGYKAITVTVGQVRSDHHGRTGLVLAAPNCPAAVEADEPTEVRA